MSSGSPSKMINPPRFYEPLPSGPWKGKTTSMERVIMRRNAYFETLGWDERGVPMKEALDTLGLKNLESQMAKLRD